MRLPARPTPLNALLEHFRRSLPRILTTGVGALPGRTYPHWDQLRRHTPPDGLTQEEWWLAIKLARLGAQRVLPLQAADTSAFTYCLPPVVERMLHQVDRDASGQIALPEPVTNPQTRDRFLVRSLMEEAITSSQLEGAATTLQDAKEMIRQDRKPQTRDERMIMNNFQAMARIREISHEPLTRELILELHTLLTEGTLDDPEAVGRWRRSDEDVKVIAHDDQAILHVPPPADSLPERLDRLIEFANGRDDAPFIHPVIRSILIHLMIGYDHPFVDGNGRTARALFYWSMVRHGYWLMEFISISSRLRLAPSRYARAYLHTETDDNDATYFIIHQLEVMLDAIRSWHSYLERKIGEAQAAEQLLRRSVPLRSTLNHRQIALILHALKHPLREFTVKSHMRSHNITYETARTDLLRLAESGLLNKITRGRAFVFSAPVDLRQRLEAMAGGVGPEGIPG